MTKQIVQVTILCVLCGPLAAAETPNILLILADDLGYGDVRCYNERSEVATPHIDRLAREGMRFSDAHSPCTVCTPTLLEQSKSSGRSRPHQPHPPAP